MSIKMGAFFEVLAIDCQQSTELYEICTKLNEIKCGKYILKI